MAPKARYESDNEDPQSLAQPLHYNFSGKTAPNRFLKAAMTERQSSWHPTDLKARGIPSEELINLYRKWGEGQVGTILTGNIMIESDQLEAPGNPIIPRGEPMSGPRFEAFKKLAAAAKSKGSLIIGQPSHPGRQTPEKLQPNPVSASDVQLEGEIIGMTFAKPHAATREEIANVIEAFAHAAEYLYKAGFDGVELHGAHGYLLAQFLATSTNKRTDEYGGSLENRSRIIFEIIQAIRKRVPTEGFIISIKINSVEFQKGGFQPEEAKQLCASLEANKVDFVELSGGTYEQLAFLHKRESTKARESYFIEFVEQIVPGMSQTRTFITGGFKTVGAMVKALKVVDGVGLGRAIAQEPRLVQEILAGNVKGAIKQQLDDNNFGLTNVAAGSLMRSVGNGREPVDLSRDDHVKAFYESMEKWQENMAKDSGSYSYGYVDIHADQPHSYGEAY